MGPISTRPSSPPSWRRPPRQGLPASASGSQPAVSAAGIGWRSIGSLPAMEELKMIDGPVARLKVRSDIAARIPPDEPYCAAYSTTAIDRVLADRAPNWEIGRGAGATVWEILVVEDDEDLRESLAETLGVNGHIVRG